MSPTSPVCPDLLGSATQGGQGVSVYKDKSGPTHSKKQSKTRNVPLRHTWHSHSRPGPRYREDSFSGESCGDPTLRRGRRGDPNLLHPIQESVRRLPVSLVPYLSFCLRVSHRRLSPLGTPTPLRGRDPSGVPSTSLTTPFSSLRSQRTSSVGSHLGLGRWSGQFLVEVDGPPSLTA